MKSICSINTKEKIIALSFDDGPVVDKTSIILDILKENHAEAAFHQHRARLGQEVRADIEP